MENQSLTGFIYPAEDVEGTYLASCVEFDVISTGTTVEHAADMIAEACEMVLEENGPLFAYTQAFPWSPPGTCISTEKREFRWAGQNYTLTLQVYESA